MPPKPRPALEGYEPPTMRHQSRTSSAENEENNNTAAPSTEPTTICCGLNSKDALDESCGKTLGREDPEA